MARRRKGRPVHGILLVNKALGVSSNAVLQRAKFIYKAQKAGHTGSLDPLATGMLPICFGEATKVSGLLLDANKHYRTVAQLGVTTTTGDAEGDVLSDVSVNADVFEKLEAVLARFTGKITQIPPMYSALKKDGKPLYELARQGITIERAARDVHIERLSLIEQTGCTITLDVECSKGTYIRSLVEDIGQALGCGAYVKQLHRTAVEPFTDCPVYHLADVEAYGDIDQLLLPIDAALPMYPAIHLSFSEIQSLRHGQPIVNSASEVLQGLCRIYDKHEVFHGIGEGRVLTESPSEQVVIAPKRMMVFA